MIILQFSLPTDEIIKYSSPVGNNDVPHPFATSKTKTYLILEGKYFENKFITKKNKLEPHKDYYEKLIAKKEIHSFEYKVIHERMV